MTRVFLPSHLRNYSAGVAELEFSGDTVDALLWSLEKQHPGLRVRIIDEQDRIRPHIKLFLDGEQIKRLDLPAGRELHILAALSGG